MSRSRDEHQGPHEPPLDRVPPGRLIRVVESYIAEGADEITLRHNDDGTWRVTPRITSTDPRASSS
ncbi:MAG: hypothetical protein SFZ24_07145 [Planctomycetota bacterium]|nr:hypothetical protein [Planctomycetota bacterium]